VSADLGARFVRWFERREGRHRPNPRLWLALTITYLAMGLGSIVVGVAVDSSYLVWMGVAWVVVLSPLYFWRFSRERRRARTLAHGPPTT
jgi:Flp pilus assembly protein TadB